MKKYLTITISILIASTISFAQSGKEENTFSNMENAVGYLVDDLGNKYIIIESGDGAKLVKVRENPKNFFGNDFGITREDIKIK